MAWTTSSAAWSKVKKNTIQKDTLHDVLAEVGDEKVHTYRNNTCDLAAKAVLLIKKRPLGHRIEQTEIL